ALLMVQGVATGGAVLGGTMRRAGVEEGIEGAQALLRERITSAWPATRYDQPKAYADFSGDERSLTFWAPAPMASGDVPLRRYHLVLQGKGDLVLKGRPDRAREDAAPEVLLRGVAALHLSYLDDAGEWRRRWMAQPRPPRLVRVEVRFGKGDGRWWPPLTIHPMTTIDIDCVQGDVAGVCAGR
ncbi:MAG: hypothetical protein PHS60_17080, partial [Zavarzinia sp.]|nr:hypothetical protein [Zavarzinia sp.]